MDDGSFQAVVYQNPVHYLDNGVWKDIDNTLVDEGSDVTNKDNDFKIKFAKKSNDSKLVTIQEDKYEIAWGIARDKKVAEDAVNKMNAVDNVVENGKIAVGISDEEKKKAVPNTSSTVDYENIYNNVDLQYKLESDTVKENIIINKKIDSPVFEFALQLKNVVPKLNDDKTITFYDEKDSSKSIYKIDAPYMYDAKNHTSNKINVKLLKNNNQYVIQVIPDSSWLNDENTCYPVVLDLSVSTSITASNFTTCVLDTGLNQVILQNGIQMGVKPVFVKM